MPIVPAPRCSGLSEKCVFQAASRLHFLTGLTLHAQQSRAAFSLYVGAALPLQPCPAGRARRGHYTPKCGSATATTHSPAGEERTCSLRSIWDKQVWLLSSSGRVWEAVAHAGSLCHHTSPRGTGLTAAGQRELAHSKAWLRSPCCCPAHPRPFTPRGHCCAAQPGLAAVWGGLGS